MAGFMTGNTENLTRTNIWQRQLKELLLDDLHAMQFVRTITDFPDGQTLNIPSFGQAETSDFTEGQAIRYNSMDTGNFTFSFNRYIYSANAITEKFKRDSYYSSDLISAFVPRQHRAIMERIEADILAVGNSAQAASDLNAINGGNHRWVGSGTSGALTINDLARIHYSLQKARVPLNNLCAIVDPSVAYTLQTQANAVNLLSPQPEWGNMVHTGLTSGFRFKFSLMGFDFYVSNYLPNGISETINSVAVTNGVANYFFSSTPGDTQPFVGAFRQMPTVYTEFNKDLQQWEYLTITEYGFKLYRPENLVTILTSTSVVS